MENHSSVWAVLQVFDKSHQSKQVRVPKKERKKKRHAEQPDFTACELTHTWPVWARYCIDAVKTNFPGMNNSQPHLQYKWAYQFLKQKTKTTPNNYCYWKRCYQPKHATEIVLKLCLTGVLMIILKISIHIKQFKFFPWVKYVRFLHFCVGQDMKSKFQKHFGDYFKRRSQV